ncbi:MAG: GntR family transcriptional regulator [Chloroflexi bacterium]|nr:GntR family transcriptional regulator [Chloroflexota bacterium]
MVVDFPPVHRFTVASQVAAALRDKIISGELPPGHRLREVELAERLGVSRNVLREAFRQLMGESLLVTHPHRGTFVWQPDQQELWELFTLRAAIEGMCVRLAVMAGKREDLVAGLRVRVDEMAAAGPADQQASDQRFHETIVRLAGNHQIWEIWRSRHPSIWLASWPAFVPPDLGSLVDRHRPLVEILARATPAEAQEALIAHIQEAMETTLQTAFAPSERAPIPAGSRLSAD